MNSLKKYATILLTFFTFSIKSKLTYRMNLVFKLVYGPVYVMVLFSILLLAYTQTDNLSGWNRQDAILLFSVFQLIYSTCLILFIDAIRHLLWSGIRLGEVDTWLLKPGSAQFYLTFSKPNTDLVGLWLCIFVLFCYQLRNLSHLSAADWLAFSLVFFLAHVIVYLTLSTYATIGFHVARAQQIVELFDKGTDFSQYPLSIFPQSIQFIMLTFMPIAFFSYVPTLFLRKQGSTHWMLITIGITIVLFLINKYSWKYALRKYSSASS